MLAMLFEMTSTFICWANMPVAAMLRDRMASYSLRAWSPTDPANDVAGTVVLVVHHCLHLLIAAGDLDHPRHLGDGHDVRFFERALDHLGIGRQAGDLVGDEHAVGARLQRVLVGEADHAQLAE